MSKVSGSEKIRRTCLIRGRENEGRFSLIRKSVNLSKVLAQGQEGEGEDVDSNLVYDERISPRPTRVPNKANNETKFYPADKPLRRVCFLHDKGDTKFHLLRKGVELSKVLEVGQEGQGSWVNTSDIRDEYNVPIQTKSRVVERKPVRLCKLANDPNGQDQEYLVLRKTDKGAKLLPVYDGNYGITITDLSQIVDEKVINQAKKGRKSKKGEASMEPDDSDEQMDNEPETQPTAPQPQPTAPHPQPTAPHTQPTHTQPTVPGQAVPGQTVPGQPVPQVVPGQTVPGQVVPGQPAPGQVAPVAPVAAQPARPAPAAAQNRPNQVPNQGAPRPQPVGAAPRATQGRPATAGR